MSLDFLNNITSNITKAVKSGDVGEVIGTMQKMVIGGKKRFTHGNNVIMIRGTHKGYYGHVNPDEFQPARYEIEIEEDQYIPISRYGDIEIGKEIQTEFGKSTIMNRIPKLVEIEGIDKKMTLRFMESDLMRVVAYTEGDKLRLAKLENVERTDNKLNCEIIPFNIPSMKDEGDGLQQLSSVIKSGNLNSIFENKKSDRCDIMDVKFPEYYIVITKPNNETDQNYLGTFGRFTRVIPEQYLIKHKKTIYVMPSNIKPKVGNKKIKGESVDVVKGAFKGKTGKIIKKYDPRLVVYIEAAGKRVSEHYVKDGDNFVLTPITPKDVFYMDLKLKNGNDFEVRDITESGNFIGVERGKNYRTKEITPEEVLMYQPGFSVVGMDTQIAKMDDSYVSDDTQYVSDTDEQEEVYEDEEENDAGDVSSYEEETSRGEEGEEYGFSYKDIDRITYQPKGLTSEEESIKARINKIIRNYGINESEINVYGMIESVVEIIKKLKAKLGGSEEFKNIWVGSDEKYIIACVVFYEIIRSGMEYLFVDNFNDILGSYIATLASNKYFLPNDIKNTIFLKKGWSSTTVVNENLLKTLKKNKDNNSLYTEMFKNCERYLGTIMEIPDIEKVSRVLTMEKLIPVGVHKTKRQREEEMENEPYVKKFAYVSDVISDNMPESATKILWDPSYESVLERFRGRLMEKINSERSNKSTKIVYEYVLDNFEQAPFELKRMEGVLNRDTNLKIDKVKYDTLKMVWGELLNYVKRQMQINKERREIKTTKRQKEKDAELSKRRVAMELMGPMKTLGLDMDSDEEMSDVTQKKQKRK